MKKKIEISDKVLNQIKQKEIRPIPRWEFRLKNWGLWLGLAASLIVLMMGVGLSWFGLVDNIITPYFWILIAILFLTISFLIFEKTKKAYRFEKWMVAIFICLFGLVVGGLIFKAGWADRIDQDLELSIPYYRHMVPIKMEVWNNPDAGYLSGRIIEVADINNFKIKDFNNKIWSIRGQEPLIRGQAQIKAGEEIKLIGEQIDGATFEAREIRPWSGGRQNRLKEN